MKPVEPHTSRSGKLPVGLTVRLVRLSLVAVVWAWCAAPAGTCLADKCHVWDALQWPSADQMRHLKTFLLSEGPKCQRLVPNRELLDPRESGPARGYVGWALKLTLIPKSTGRVRSTTWLMTRLSFYPCQLRALRIQPEEKKR